MGERTQRVSAWSLLSVDWRGAAVTCLLTALSMMLAVLLVGVFLFGFAAAQQLRRHVRFAFGATAKHGWAAPMGVAVGALVIAVLVVGAWFGMVERVWPSYGVVTPPLPIARDALLVLGLVPLYLLTGWLLTPVLFVAVVASDPAAPTSWRDRLTRALRATLRLPFWTRLGAIALSGVVLVGPLILLMLARAPGFALLLLGSWCLPLPVLSALLVSRYADVRDELDRDEVRVLRVPGMLILFAVVAAASSLGALFRGSLLQLVFLGFGWFLSVLAFYRYVGAHRIGKLAGGDVRAPGRRAVEGTVRGRRLVTADGLAFTIPAERSVGLVAEEPYTLVGDFGAYRESFRESADQPWPKGATLRRGRLADLMERRMQRAVWWTWLALGCVTVLAVGIVL